MSGGIGSLALSSGGGQLSVVADMCVRLGGRNLSVVVAIIVVVLLVVVVCAVEDVSSVWEFSSSTGKDISACADKVCSEGELLAVEDKEISIFVLSFLGSSALSLESLNSVFLV